MPERQRGIFELWHVGCRMHLGIAIRTACEIKEKSESMSEYEYCRRGKLKLKGEKLNSKKRKTISKIYELERPIIQTNDDTISHGGWRKVVNVTDICGAIALEFGKNAYIKALDNGLFTLGDFHKEGEGPAPEEILTSFQINGNKIAFKSGYGKYVKVETNGTITAISEAVGNKEQWEPIFEKDKTALLAENGNFMTIDAKSGACLALRSSIELIAPLIIRSYALKPESESSGIATEEKGDLNQVEVNYVKKFQKFQDKKLRINKLKTKELKLAKTAGNLHEILLDRRSKMKADRYCK